MRAALILFANMVALTPMTTTPASRYDSLCRNSIEIRCLEFWLKNGLIFHFNSVNCLNYPFFLIFFISVRNLKPKLKWFFKAKIQAKKMSIELPPC